MSNMEEVQQQEHEDQQPLKKPAYLLDFAELGKMMVKDMSANGSLSALFKKHSKEDVIKFLDNPAKHEKSLRDISNFLYTNSMHYKRGLLYLAGMPTYDHTVEPYNFDINKYKKSTFLKAYTSVLHLLEVMDIKHEFQKILRIAFKDDVFYGYEHQLDDSYFMQPLNPDYCAITSIEDGCYTFSFNFRYFDKYPDKLNEYPQEFNQKYKIYQDDKKSNKWQEIDAKNSCCIKIHEELTYSVPFFAGAFKEVFDIEDYKSLRKAGQEMENYAVLIEKIPMKKDSDKANDFSLELEDAVKFHNQAAQTLPSQIGLMLSPFEKVDVVRFSKDRSDADNVAKAERDWYSSIGVSQLLFNQEKSGSIGLTNSIKVDEELIFGVLRQLERWLNRKIKFMDLKYNFKVKLLDITIFNKKEVIETYLKAAQFGAPVKMDLFAALGNSPASLLSKAYLENNILGIPDTWIPLQSSHTQNGNDSEGGKPPKDEDDLTDAGAANKDLDANDNRAK